MRLKNNIGTVHSYMVAMLFFLMMFLPYNIIGVKVLFMGSIILMTCIRLKTMRANKYALLFMMLFLVYAVLAAFLGYARATPGWSGFARLNIIYYVALFICIVPIKKDKDIMLIVKTVYLAAISISLYAFFIVIYYKGIYAGLWPEYSFLLMDDFLMVGFHESYLHITNTNLSMMSIVYPIIVLAYDDERVKCIITQKFYYLAVIISSVACFLSGRRILWIICILTILARYIKSIPVKQMKNLLIFGSVLGIIAILALNMFTNFTIKGLVDRLIDPFLSTDTLYGGENVRYASIRELFVGFMENIWWGSGAGIGVDNVVRNTLEPWCYEVSYSLILYNSGIIGTAIYISALFIIVFCLFKLKNDKLAYAFGVAYVLGIIANGTNPYFSGSFDFLVFIFIPLVYVNSTQAWRKNG